MWLSVNVHTGGERAVIFPMFCCVFKLFHERKGRSNLVKFMQIYVYMCN